MSGECEEIRTPEISLIKDECASERENMERPISPVTSCVSIKSDQSMPLSINFKEKTPAQERETEERPNSPESSCLSYKSDQSKPLSINFKDNSEERGTEERANSPLQSCVSFKSDQSKPLSINFNDGTGAQERGTTIPPNSPISSMVSFKSDQSKPLSVNFAKETDSQEIHLSLSSEGDQPLSGTDERSNSPESRCVSLKSDQSKPLSINFKGGKKSQKRSKKSPKSSVSKCHSLKSNQSKPLSINFNEGARSPERQLSSSSLSQLQQTLNTDRTTGINSKDRGHQPETPARKKPDKLEKKCTDFLYNIFNDLENKMIVFIKHELEMFKKLLRKENTKYYGDVRDDLWSVKEAALDMALYFLKLMDHSDLADALQDALIGIQQRALKSNLCKKYQHVWEGIAKQGETNILNKIYTDLYITAGGVKQMNEQHEVGQIERKKTSVKTEKIQMDQEEQIECKNMFEPLPEDKPIRTVLTQGVAGIGKSICVQKFVLDWAEGNEYQDIKFIFSLPFRELNLKDKDKLKVKGMRFTDRYKMLFIFDGLDECRLPLAFYENEKWTDVSTPTSVDTIMTNLIAGNLLPSALIWITTRPAAAAKIPAEHVDRVTEVRGFNDDQKVEYFRKKITNEGLANRIIERIKASRSLFIMCHIPVFCWISATVLEGILETTDSEDIPQAETTEVQTPDTQTPQTLTDMYTCFLIFQTVQGEKKYSRKNASDIPWDKKGILSLGNLAFNLEACGIDPDNIKVYSGVCTQETGRFLGTVFSFVHLSIQEFVAALFTYVSVRNDKKNVFDGPEEKELQVIDLLKTTVDKALESENGHLDLFLRFLLGLSLESNQKLIRGLLTHTGTSSDCQKDIVQYIKSKFEQNPSAERSINLFYCLKELNDDSLVKEIQSYMNSGGLSEAELSPAQWSALVFKFIRSDECFKRLIPVVKEAKKAILSQCNLTEGSCSAFHPVLSSDSSNLTEVDLSRNPLKNAGVKELCAGLKSPKCKLEKLRLSDCSITEEGYTALAEALKSNHSSKLLELDLRGNDPGASGVKLLTELNLDPKFKLRLLKSEDAEKACVFLNEIVGKNPLLQKELDLSGKVLKDSEVKQISALLKDLHCRPERLTLKNSGITDEHCSVLTSSFHSNPEHIKELDMSENELRNSGVQPVCDLLKHEPCKLEILRLSDCSITEKGYTALAEALRSNPTSHLIELDLRGNDPGASGVKLLTDLLQDPHCTLNTLRLVKSPEAEEACKDLTNVLNANPLLQKDLNLSGKIVGDSKVKQLCALLKDSHCRPEKLTLNKCGLMMESCEALAEVLTSSPCFLTELDLSNNSLQNSGVQRLSEGLKNQSCSLKILRLSDCSITEEGYTALAEALRSNPSSHLIELDLRGNDPGASGVMKLTGLQRYYSKLKTLSLLKSPAAQEAWTWLNSVLGENPLLLKELNLSIKETEDSTLRVKQLSALIEDTHCKFTTIRLNQCNVSEESCSALATALTLKSCSVRELELSNNSLQDSGVSQLSAGLKHHHCKLQVLRLNTCDLMEGSGSALAEVFKSERSQLRELELSNNSLQDSGVTQLSAGLKHRHCKLQVLKFNKCDLTDGSCSALAEVLSSEVSQLRELELSNNNLQDSGVTQLSAGLKNPQSQLTIMRLCNCSVSAEGCAALAKALEENRSRLTELHLSGNNAGDSGIKHISNLLQNPHCVLEKLIVNDNNIREEGYTALAEALRSSHLIELDLRGNDPGASGVKLLTDLLQDPHCTLETLRLVKSGAAQEGYDLLYRVLGKNPLLQRELTVNEKIHGDSQVKQISALLEDSHCRPETLTLNKSGMRSEGCAALASALSLNPSQLRELDLSGNTLGGSGMKLGGLLRNQQFKLQKLWLCKCSLTEEDCADVVAALRTNPSHLQELDLSDNTVGSRGVKELSDLLQNSNCTLEKLKLYNCSLTEQQCTALADALKLNSSSHLKELDLRKNFTVPMWNIFKYFLGNSNSKLFVRILNAEAEKACDYLTKRLNKNPLLEKTLDLSGKISGDSDVKQLSVLLKDPQCRTEKLRLRNSSVTERSCTDLISALTTNPSHLTELDLSENTLGNAGVIQISTLLKTPSCKLHTLRLSDCNIKHEGYAALTEALRSNPSSPLIELDLRGNHPGESGVKALRNLMNYPKYKLKTLRLLKSPDAQKSDLHLREVLGINPILQADLDLSGKIEGDSGVEHLSALLKDPHCRPEKLQLSECNMTVKGCSALLEALRSESSTLRELNLSKNRIQDSGVKLLSAELKRKHCKLETVRLSDCSITEEGYTALAEALRSNPSSHLKELDLRGNEHGESGLMKLIEIQKDRYHKLETLSLLKSADAAEALRSLSKIVGEDPLLHRELDLSRKTPGDVNVKNLSALLQDPHYRLQKLTLYKEGSIKEDDCVGLFSALGLNPSHLRELNLNRNKPGESGLRNLCDFLKNPECKLQKLQLRNSSVTERSCTDLISALTTNPSHLTELDLSENTLGNAGVIQISTLLKTPSCKLHTLLLSDCNIKHEGYAALTEALRSNPSSPLRELDLRGNHPGESGVKEIRNLMNDPEYKLKTLRLLKSPDAQKSDLHLREVLGINPILQTDLDLSGKIEGDSGVEHLSALLKDLLKDPHCRPEKLQLSECNMTVKGCSALLEALRSESSTLRELNLSKNRIQDSGVKLLSAELKRKHCKLETVRLSDCSITEEGYTALAEALRSNPSSHLKELDLRGNDPGESGVKKLIEIQKNHKLETLSLLKSADAAEALRSLSKIVGEDPLLHRELDLSRKTPGDVNVKNLSALLQDPHYRLQKLTLYKEGSIKEDDCVGLFSALGLNPSHLRELNLNRNKPGESGLRNLCDFLKNPECKLQKLQLCKCSLTEEDCADVVAALRTNPSHLQELDLSDNTVGSRGVKELSDLLQNSNCTLEKLKINNCSLLQQQCEDLAEALKSNSSLIELHLRQNDPDSVLILLHYLHNSNHKLNLRIVNNPEAEQACDHLTEVLGTNPLLLKELDLSGKISGDSGVKLLSALLKDPLCRSEKLRLRNSSVTERSCTDLISALTTNPSHLTELDLSENTLGNAGVIQISTLLKTPSCKLHTLLLSDCNIKHEGYAALTEALRSNPSSPLIELDLRGNHPGESGVKEIRNLMNDPEYKLKTLRLLKSPDAQKSYLHLREVLGINPILQTDLDLSGKIEGDSGVEHLSALLKDPHCRPEKLQLSECNMTVKGCSALLEALRSESSTLRELNLSKNRIEDSGVKLLSAELMRKHCKLETVRLSDCSITEEGYTALAEALRSNPSSHLKELDLRGNDPGESGVKKLIEIQKNHQLETLRLLKSADAAEALRSLSKIVGENPLLHRELDLSRKTPGDVNVKNLSALLQDPHYRLQKLTLYKEGSIKEDDCVGLFSALDLNPSHLRELNLNRNKPGESGLRNLCDFLKNPECKLQKLQTCKILSDESCADVASALCTNPSHIRTLNLRWCKLGDSGVKKLCDLLKKHECKLEKLRLKQCRISDGSCSALTEALKLHSHLKELDLRNTKVNDAVKKQLSEILERSGGSLITDKLSWMKSKLPRPGKKQETATSDPKSSTAQGEEREGEMQNTEPGGSDVDSNADSSEDEDDDDSQQDQDSKGTDIDVYIPDPQTVETSL
ncbi:hypothetical protein HF521_003485 [Silurus meridionalis]|uniref:FISNA domain-containing protein n=1 Tax=Silurus meridionalis TaxID=175797 RepID=A0A8T0AYH2_SILME|nr:hypothetical protein HF521_003485 [Silurus meridionalis]